MRDCQKPTIKTHTPQMNYQTIMFSTPAMTLVNTIMLIGIVLAILASIGLKKSNAKLHEKNIQQRAKIGY